MGEFEQWFSNQDFYANMRFIHGDNLFSKDGDVYRVLPVQMACMAYQERPKPLLGKPFNFDLLDSYKEKIEGLEKKLGALNLLLANWNDEYTQNTTNHETTTDAVLRTCITELNRILRGEL